ncbi:uncharacterized protein LOC125780447 [Astyanax mexicanus]|uniref:uncharacterized protein LOC125780447 n=1 Tax=Astyanax mexicanus TaxID=7994 RepID=UPI0020CAEAF2|nr:uncharacterized protein LOC125780447 [Astyanax mexicanus]
MPPVTDFLTDTSNKLNFVWSSALAVNITISPKPWNNYDHQNIVMLEDDPVVVQSASFLFEKHPSRSTLLSYRSGILNVIRGAGARLTKKSRVVLVGHGSKGNDGASRLGSYGPEEIATVVGAMKIEGGHIQTLSLVGCYLGSDLHFAKKLLSTLRDINIKAELQLLTSPVSVSPAGEQLTMDGNVWRHRDGSKKVIAWLNERGTFQTRMENGNIGEIVPSYEGHPLYMHILEWPTHPQMFVPADLRKKYKSIVCLEGLTWSLFFEEREIRRALDFIPTGDLSPVWLEGQEPKAEVEIKHITNILDLVLEIRHHAREDENFDTYYVLNDFVFKVQKKTFHTSLVGKYMSNQQETQTFLDALKDQKDHYTIPELMQNLEASKFNEFCRQTFHMKQCDHNCGWWSHFFMEAVFSASIRNFRTFSLFLMSVIACEVSRSQGKDNSICSAFVSNDYPMMHEDPWPFHERRGFYGCTIDDTEKTKRERVFWLDEVVSKENSLYSRSKKMMVGVDHDQETELDVFGKVKVMNQYAFASYLEFFRGTIEGKKLSRGCAENAVYEPDEKSH